MQELSLNPVHTTSRHWTQSTFRWGSEDGSGNLKDFPVFSQHVFGKDMRDFDKIVYSHGHFPKQSMEDEAVAVNFLSSPHGCSSRHGGCSDAICSSDESFDVYIRSSSLSLGVSLDPEGRGMPATRQSRVPWGSGQVSVALTPSQGELGGGEKLELFVWALMIRCWSKLQTF